MAGEILLKAIDSVIDVFSRLSSEEIMDKLDRVQPGPLSEFLTTMDPGTYFKGGNDEKSGIQ